MKEKETIYNVLDFTVVPELFIIGKTNFEVIQSYSFYTSLTNSGCAKRILGEYVFLQYGEFSDIIILTLKGETLKILDEGMNLYSSVHYKNGILIRNRKTKSFWKIDRDLEISELNLDIRFTTYINTVFYKRNSIEINRVYPETTWQTDISTFGRYLNLRGEQQPNEIDGDLMGYENLLFVPMKGGQLLALDVETGEKVWIQDYNNGRSGFYTLYSDKIYKHDGLSLIEIDVITGARIREMIFPEYKADDLKTFYALHYFWVYDDIIIMYGHKNRIAIINRESFQIIKIMELPASLPASKDNVIWHDNKLYVLDLTNTLHVYERE